MITCRERHPLHFNFSLNYRFRLFAWPKSQPASDICMGDMWQSKATEENQDTSVKTTSETRDSRVCVGGGDIYHLAEEAGLQKAASSSVKPTF